jgi:type III pantothenate kinase
MQSEETTYHGVVDIGNTSVKMAVFRNREIDLFVQSSHSEWVVKWQELSNMRPITKCVFSNVSEPQLSPEKGWIEFLSIGPLGRIGKYQFADHVGKDRVAAMFGGSSLVKATQFLVVDLGSCVTYNWAKEQDLIGLAIAPGRAMRWRAMHDYTARLPFINASDKNEFRLFTTEDNLWKGGHQAWLIEVLGMIAFFQKEYSIDEILITGSDAVYLKDFLTENMKIVEHLNLVGMNNWLYEN